MDRTKTLNRAAIAALAVVLAASPALAHHPLGGATPDNFLHGLLSGFGHPVIGFDHLAFIVAVGVASAFFAARYVLPLVFIAGTLAGCLLFVSGVQLPQIEMFVAASILLLGALVMSGYQLPAVLVAALFAAAGLFHGSAYAGAIIGAEATPLAAYVLGFGLVQYAIAAAMVWITQGIWQAASASAVQPRLAGAVVAGVGATFLIEHVEALVFPGM